MNQTMTANTAAETLFTYEDETVANGWETEGWIDRVMWALRPNQYEAPSVIARRAKVKTSYTSYALSLLAQAQMARSSGNGAWTRYAAWQ